MPAEAIRDASLAAARTVVASDNGSFELLNDPLVEIEVVGPTEEISAGESWTEPRAADPYVEPGIHGLALIGDRISHRFCPTELITSDMVLSDALKMIAEKSHASAAELGRTRLFRFRSVHWYQADARSEIISLERGMTLVPPGAVTAQSLDQSIQTIAEYMAYRQQESGLFSYQYEPSLNRYSDENNLVRQVGATLAMAAHARRSKKSASRAAADLGIRSPSRVD
jgi:hypothetical protein